VLGSAHTRIPFPSRTLRQSGIPKKDLDRGECLQSAQLMNELGSSHQPCSPSSSSYPGCRGLTGTVVCATPAPWRVLLRRLVPRRHAVLLHLKGEPHAPVETVLNAAGLPTLHAMLACRSRRQLCLANIRLSAAARDDGVWQRTYENRMTVAARDAGVWQRTMRITAVSVMCTR